MPHLENGRQLIPCDKHKIRLLGIFQANAPTPGVYYAFECVYCSDSGIVSRSRLHQQLGNQRLNYPAPVASWFLLPLGENRYGYNR